MKLVKCEKGHAYDAEKFLSCPHCVNCIAEPEVKDIMGKEQEKVPTIPSGGAGMAPDAGGSVCQDGVPEYRRKVLGKTVGWLVCINGGMTGESFILREGDNCIGRADYMDVALTCEPTVSRNRHAIITYDPVRNSFLLHSPENMEQILLNDKSMKKPKTLKPHDVITLGDCSLLFVALCGAGFRWKEEGTEQ